MLIIQSMKKTKIIVLENKIHSKIQEKKYWEYIDRKARKASLTYNIIN